MKYRFNRTAIPVLGLTALLTGCTPSSPPAETPTAPVSAPTQTPAAVTQTPAASADTPTPAATGEATPEANLSPGITEGANVPTVQGVVITVTKPGSGTPLAKGETASFQYTGWLEGFGSEKKFDSSLDRQPSRPITIAVGSGQVIPGWDQGLIGMQTGEVRRLEISSEMAYGADGRPPAIPPNSTLYFEVERVANP